MQSSSRQWPGKPDPVLEIDQVAAALSATKKIQTMYQLIWIKQGSGDLFIGCRKIPLQPNLLFFIRPGHHLQLKTGTEINGLIFRFPQTALTMDSQDHDSQVNPVLNYLFAREHLLMKQATIDEVNPVVEQMLKEYNNPSLFSTSLLKKYFHILLLYISRHFEDQINIIPQTRNIEIAEKFIALLEEQFRDNKKVSDYASQMALKPNYLNEIVKKVTGFPAGHHIRQRVILEAKRLIFYSDTCRKQIAWYLGFDDTAHFSKFFKKETGRNFTDFKKEKVVVTFTPAIAI